MPTLLLACLALAQVETGMVLAVSVDAAVRDAQGRSIPGLSAGDFAVELDGEPRRVVAVTYYPSGAPMAGAIGPSFDTVSTAPAVYRIVVQPPDDTPVGREFAVAVTVKRAGARIDAPLKVAAAPVTVTGTRASTASGAASADERLRTAIASGRRETGLAIAAGHTIRRAADTAQIALDVQFEITGPAAPPLKPAVGLVQARGGLRTAAPRVEAAGDGRYRVNLSMSVEPGPQRIRFGVVDAQGAIGSTEYAVNAQLRQVGPVLASDLLRWTVEADARTPWHLADIPREAGTIAAGLEIYEATGGVPPDLLVKIELAGGDRGATPLIERIVTPEVRERVLAADAEFPLERIPAGAYTIRATLLSGTTALGTVSANVFKR